MAGNCKRQLDDAISFLFFCPPRGACGRNPGQTAEGTDAKASRTPPCVFFGVRHPAILPRHRICGIGQLCRSRPGAEHIWLPTQRWARLGTEKRHQRAGGRRSFAGKKWRVDSLLPWGEGTSVASFPLPNPLSLLPSFLLLCSGKCRRNSRSPSTGCEEKPTRTSPQQPVRKCLTKNTAAAQQPHGCPRQPPRPCLARADAASSSPAAGPRHDHHDPLISPYLNNSLPCHLAVTSSLAP
jgi:hypothetical protein